MNIPGFDPIFSFSQEYLHGWGLGAVKRLNTWINKLLTPVRRNEVDRRMLALRSPRSMYRVLDKLLKILPYGKKRIGYTIFYFMQYPVWTES